MRTLEAPNAHICGASVYFLVRDTEAANIQLRDKQGVSHRNNIPLFVALPCQTKRRFPAVNFSVTRALAKLRPTL